MRFFLAYFAIINLTAFCMMGMDKYKARRNKWRISESSLFIAGILGGGIGMLLGMGIFRHKTRHWKFIIGIPAVVVINIILFGYMLNRFFLS